jgi:hypothetical protein
MSTTSIPTAAAATAAATVVEHEPHVLNMTCELHENLRISFNDLDFLAGIHDNQKVCFLKRYYVDKDSWVGNLTERLMENDWMLRVLAKLTVLQK